MVGYWDGKTTYYLCNSEEFNSRFKIIPGEQYTVMDGGVLEDLGYQALHMKDGSVMVLVMDQDMPAVVKALSESGYDRT